MLLESLVKSTWPDHQDFKGIHEAVSSMEQAARYVNESSRDAETLIRIQNSLIGMKNVFVVIFFWPLVHYWFQTEIY